MKENKKTKNQWFILNDQDKMIDVQYSKSKAIASLKDHQEFENKINTIKKKQK